MRRFKVTGKWIALGIVLFSVFLFGQSKLMDRPTDARSTFGPVPPPWVDTEGHVFREGSAESIGLIVGVPAYLWRHGCGPTALGMVVGYYDSGGYPDLIPGDATTQGSNVQEAIASQENYDDYCVPIDSYPNLQPDKSEPPVGDEHEDNCLADFMYTSQSAHFNYYGWSWNSHIKPSFENYLNLAGYIGTCNSYTFDSFSWSALQTEIDNNRPMVFLVDTDGDGYTDHFITVIGYQSESGTNYYGCYNTWDTNIHWYEYRKIGTGTWGVYGAHTFQGISSLPVKGDLNGDGRADIIWRYYGTGGYNAVWLRGTVTTASVSGIFSGKMKNNPGIVDMENMKPTEKTGEAAAAAKVDIGMSLSIQELRKRGIKDGFEEYKIPKIDQSKALSDPFDFYMKKGKAGQAVSRKMASTVADPRDDPEAVELPTAKNTDWKLCGTGDFNGDNKVDLVWRNLIDGRNLVWYMDGVTLTGTEFLPSAVNMDWTLCDTGDFNRDGNVDLVWRNISDGRNLVWYLDGVTLTGTEFLPSAVNMDWTLCGTGDFNNDGNVDLAWRNLSDGRNLVWYLDGVTLTGTEFLPRAVNMDWTLCGSGDFNDDGKVDLLWQNLSNGGNLIWYLDGITLTGTESLTTVTNTTWKIEN